MIINGGLDEIGWSPGFLRNWFPHSLEADLFSGS